MTVCQGCGAKLPPNKNPGNPRKWCKELCRKRTLYGKPCIDCGGLTDGSRGTVHSSERCQSCRNEYQHETRHWTPERVVTVLQEWASELGRAPTSSEALLAGAPVGCAVVQREFGSWNAGMAAAGFPRADAAIGLRERLRRDDP